MFRWRKTTLEIHFWEAYGAKIVILVIGRDPSLTTLGVTMKIWRFPKELRFVKRISINVGLRQLKAQEMSSKSITGSHLTKTQRISVNFQRRQRFFSRISHLRYIFWKAQGPRIDVNYFGPRSVTGHHRRNYEHLKVFKENNVSSRVSRSKFALEISRSKIFMNYFGFRSVPAGNKHIYENLTIFKENNVSSNVSRPKLALDPTQNSCFAWNLTNFHQILNILSQI